MIGVIGGRKDEVLFRKGREKREKVRERDVAGGYIESAVDAIFLSTALRVSATTRCARLFARHLQSVCR